MSTTHMLWLGRCSDIICTLHTFSLWEWSDQWRISPLITSYSMKYPFTLKLSPVNSVYRSVSFKVCLYSAPRTNTDLEKFEARYWEFSCRKFKRLTNQIPCYYSYWFRICIYTSFGSFCFCLSERLPLYSFSHCVTFNYVSIKVIRHVFGFEIEFLENKDIGIFGHYMVIDFITRYSSHAYFHLL